MGLKLSCRCPLPLNKSIQTSCRHGQGNEGDEGDEGNEEEEREQDCEGQPCQGNGAPWQQGKNRWRLDGIGPDEEQGRQDCEQEAECCVEAQVQDGPRAMEPGSGEGTQGIEDHGLRRDQEGLTPLRQGEGVLQCVSTALSPGEASQAPAPAVRISAAVERRSPSFYQLQ